MAAPVLKELGGTEYIWIQSGIRNHDPCEVANGNLLLLWWRRSSDVNVEAWQILRIELILNFPPKVACVFWFGASETSFWDWNQSKKNTNVIHFMRYIGTGILISPRSPFVVRSLTKDGAITKPHAWVAFRDSAFLSRELTSSRSFPDNLPYFIRSTQTTTPPPLP